MSNASPARLAALDITRQIRERNAYAHELIEKELREQDFSTQERDFAILLIKGVVATFGELDYLLDRALEKGRIKPKVRDALRISIYELFFLEKPAHIAVSQGVELVRSMVPYAAGFANKVLRNAVRLKSDFPFGDPTEDLQALAHKEAFPLWMAERLVADLGYPEAALFMEASNFSAPLFLADLNTGETIKDVAANLPNYLPNIAAGELIVADASAQATAAIATPQLPEPFLEVGSGRGTKTVLLARNAERAHGKQPQIFALDLHPFKQRLLEERIRQYRLSDVHPITGDATKMDELVAAGALPGAFTGALIDAPCSGTGTMRRHPEIRWRLEPKQVTDMAAQGLSMLRAVAAHIEPGGFVVYSTCSVLKEENEDVVEAFLTGEEGKVFALEPCATGGDDYFRSTLAPDSADSHFAAKLVRQC